MSTMILEVQPGMQTKPNPGLFKRNPPIAGEADAIERAKNGDPDAFSKLYALHKRRVYTFCLRMLGNVSEAEDMTQEAFLHLFRKLGSFRGESAFSTWLHRLTVNLVLMHLRKKGLNLVSLEETINPSEDDAPKRDFGSRDNQLAGSVDRVTLERAVASLPPGYRMVFVLHDVEGFEHNEIASMLECSTGNSKSQLHKARLKLRRTPAQPRTVRPPRIWKVRRLMSDSPALNDSIENFDNMTPGEDLKSVSPTSSAWAAARSAKTRALPYSSRKIPTAPPSSSMTLKPSPKPPPKLFEPAEDQEPSKRRLEQHRQQAQGRRQTNLDDEPNGLLE